MRILVIIVIHILCDLYFCIFFSYRTLIYVDYYYGIKFYCSFFYFVYYMSILDRKCEECNKYVAKMFSKLRLKDLRKDLIFVCIL